MYEEKYEGIRILAYKEGTEVSLFSRIAKDDPAQFDSCTLTGPIFIPWADAIAVGGQCRLWSGE